MAHKEGVKGRLIALEGTRGPDLAAAAKDLLRHLLKEGDQGGVSSFDASNIFYEMRRGTSDIPRPSERTLVLLYASDLAFRVRWEIGPALEEGLIVIAAPYVQSAMAFGYAAGLSKTWMRELFNFAPRPEAGYRLKEKRDPDWKAKKSEGYLEFCCKTLSKGLQAVDPLKIRDEAMEYLKELEDYKALSDKILNHKA